LIIVGVIDRSMKKALSVGLLEKYERLLEGELKLLECEVLLDELFGVNNIIVRVPGYSDGIVHTSLRYRDSISIV